MAVAPADYPALFRQYAVRSAQVTLDRVRAHEGSFVGAPQEQVFQALDFAMQLDEAWPWVKDVLLTIAPQMVQAGYQDGWAPYLLRGIDLALARGDIGTTAELQVNLGWLLQMRGDFDGADAWYAKSLTAFERLGDDNGVGRALSHLSFIACMRNAYDRAQAQAEQALSRFDADDPERAAALNALGRTAFYRGDLNAALTLFTDSLALHEIRGDTFAIASLLRDLGMVLSALHRYQEAEDFLQRAQDLFSAARCRKDAASTQVNLGNILVETGQPSPAYARYVEANRNYQELQDELGLAVSIFNMGYAQLQMDAFAASKPHFITALRYWRTLANDFMQAETLRYLGDIHAAQGRRGRALSAFRHALHIIEPHGSASPFAAQRATLQQQLAHLQLDH